MELDHYLNVLRLAHDGDLPLDDEQRKALEHKYDEPLWVIAGPGTGKTHTLIWLVLKRVLVDDIPPQRVFLTTFTRKAASELESRLIYSRQKLLQAGLKEAAEIDISHFHIGTLHGLCSRILQDERFEPTIRIRILSDELTQQFFIRSSRNPLLSCKEFSFWDRFALTTFNYKTRQYEVPNQAGKAEGAAKLFNRITENGADVDAMFSSGDPDFERIADAYFRYEEALVQEHRTDQAHLQRHFLNYLSTAAGAALVDDGFTVVVDEYQDTNPVQEQIYFRLAGRSGDLTVVGDDDQSLYRFRGATVESLIDFDKACQAYLGKTPATVYLYENRRSHPRIVNWVNRFITNHPEMKDPYIRIRAPGKKPLVPKSGISGDYPAVMAIIESGDKKADHQRASAKMVRVIQELVDKGLVKDYSQIALLTFSTRQTDQGIGAYTEALLGAQPAIPFYNPRNRSAQKDTRFLAMIGALCSILDPPFSLDVTSAKLPRGVPEYVRRARRAFQRLIATGAYPDLGNYVRASSEAIRRHGIDPKKKINQLTRRGGRNVTISSLLFKLLAHEPFATDITDAEGGERLKALNLILAEYESLYEEGRIRIESDPTGGDTFVSRNTLYDFYAVFVEGIHDGINDPEDEDVIIQSGMINIMTIHQSKGLQFEVVFVIRPDKQSWVSDTHRMEDELDLFITRPTKPIRRSPEMRAAEDTIRLFYVAYSRAKRLLILTGTDLPRWDRVLGRDASRAPINSISQLQAQGVHIL